MKRTAIKRKAPIARSTKPMPKRAAPKANPRPKPADRRMPRKVDPEYLAFIRSQPCCVPSGGEPCSGDIEAHHFPAGKGFKDDALTVPLCHHHHIEGWHRRGYIAPMHRMGTAALFYVAQRRLLVLWRDSV